MGHDFVRVLSVVRAVVFQSITVYNRPDMCDRLHVTNLASMLLLAAAHANTSFKALVDALYNY